jgi:hypothetical protein
MDKLRIIACVNEVPRKIENKAHGGHKIMSCIYNEKVKRNIKPLIGLLIILGLSLVIVSFIGTKLGFHQEIKSAMDLVLAMVFLLAGYRVMAKTKEIYRYSIIADDLIIHRILGEKSYLVEKVKLSEIQALQNEKPRWNIIGALTKNYSRNMMKLDFCCKCKVEGNMKTFYFSPSQSMLKKISHAIETS